jgi:hypothetical protein
MKFEFFKRQQMTAIGIGYSYTYNDFFWGKRNASYLIECHFIKWTMTIKWREYPSAKL